MSSNDETMLSIRVSEFQKGKYSRNRLLFESDVRQALEELQQNWSDYDNDAYVNLIFSKSEIVKDDKTLFTLFFTVGGKNSSITDAAQNCRKALLKGIAKTGFNYKETTDLSFKDVDTDNLHQIADVFKNWAYNLEIKKRTLTSDWKLFWLPLFLILAILLGSLLFLFTKGYDGINRQSPAPEIGKPIGGDSPEFGVNSLSFQFNAVDDAFSVKSEEQTTLDVLENDRYLETKTIDSISIVEPASHGEAKVEGNSIVYTSEADYTGEDSFKYSVKVKNNNITESDSAVVNLSVTVNGDAQVVKLCAIDDYLFCQLIDGDKTKTYNIDVLKNDTYPEGETSLSILREPQFGKVGLTADNQLFYTPNEGYTGNDTLEYAIKYNNRSSKATVTITVMSCDKNSMYATNDFVETFKNEPVKIRVLENDIFMGEKPVVTIVEKPEHGTAVVEDDVVLYKPFTDYVGNDSFKYSLTGDNPFGTGSVSVTVKSSENLEYPYGIAVNDEFNVISGQGSNCYPLDNDIPPDSESEPKELKIYGIEKPAHGNAFTDGNRIVYTSTPDFKGRDTIVYYIAPSDKDGAWPEGAERGYIHINVRPSTEVVEGPVTDNPKPDLPETLYTLFVQPGESSVLELDVNANPEILDRPSVGYASVSKNSIIYRADKDEGQTSFLFEDKTVGKKGRVDVYIAKSQAKPLPDRFSTPRNQSTTLNVLVNDEPNDESNVITDVTRPTNGVVEIDEGQKTVLYTPYPEFIGWDSFTYRSSSAPDMDTLVQIFVYDKNSGLGPGILEEQEPKERIAYDDSVFTETNTPVVIRVLNNDYPVKDVLMIEEFSQPTYGKTELRDDAIIYTPEEGFNGYDSFTYSIDKKNPAGVGYVSVRVGSVPAGVNVAYNDNVTTYKNRPVIISVLRNDQRIGEAPLNVVNQPKYGKAEVVNNAIKYTPNPDFIGRDYFNYSIGSDNNVDSMAQVCVNVYERKQFVYPPVDIPKGPEGPDGPDGPIVKIVKPFTITGPITVPPPGPITVPPTGPITIPPTGPITIPPTGPINDPPPGLIDEIKNAKSSNLILILDDTLDVLNSLGSLQKAISNYLAEHDNNANLACIVVDDQSPHLLFQNKNITNETIGDAITEIRQKLNGNTDWDEDSKARNFVRAFNGASKISSKCNNDSHTFLISDGDSYKAYTQALSDGRIKLPEQVINLKKTMINLPTLSKKNK